MKAFFLLRAVLVALALALPLAPVHAQTAPQCAGLADVLAQLSTRWNEAPLWSGARDSGPGFMVLVAPDGGSWTILIVDGTGRACLAASGTSWTVPDPTRPMQEG